MVVVSQDRLHLVVVAFESCSSLRVEGRQIAVGRVVAVVAGYVGVDGMEGLGEVTGNPAGWLLYWMEDIMGG